MKTLRLAILGSALSLLTACQSLPTPPDFKIIGGGLDASFGGDGVATLAFSRSGLMSTPYAEAKAVLVTDTITVGGQTSDTSNARRGFAVVQYDDGGSVIFKGSYFPDGLWLAGSTGLVEAQGGVVLIGQGIDHDGNLYRVLARFTLEGQLDKTFGNDGSVVENLGPHRWQEDSVFGAAQSDGRLVVGAIQDVSEHEAWLSLARFTPDGVPDTRFGDEGTTRLELHETHKLSDILLQSDDKIIVLAFSNQGSVLYRFTSDGMPDATFGTAGRVSLPSATSFRSVTLQPDGKLVLAGLPFTLIRITEKGLLDTDFGDRGFAYVETLRSLSAVTDLILRADGGFVVSGEDFGTALLVGLDSGGRLDRAFGDQGLRTLTLESDPGVQILTTFSTVTQQFDGKLVAAGNLNSTHFLTVRFDAQ